MIRRDKVRAPWLENLVFASIAAVLLLGFVLSRVLP